MDIGFGDVITPEREQQNYPTLLDLPVPRLWTYPRETMVAEKFEAMVSRGGDNSRVKDIWDIACLARRFAFDGDILQTAIAETFRRCGTSFAGERPEALLPAYYGDTARAEHWRALQHQIATDADAPTRLVDAGEELGQFPGAGLRQPDRRSASSRRRGQRAGLGGPGFRLGWEAKAVTEVTGRVGEARDRRFRVYPEYKGSGVEWLGTLPSHWEVRPFKTALVRNDSGVWGEDFDDDGTIVLRSTEQTMEGTWRIEDPARRRLTASEAAYARLREGDLLVTKSSGSAHHIGKTSIVDEAIAALNCCYSNFMQRLRVSAEHIPRFFWYYMNCPVAREQLVFLSSTTTGLGNLNGSILGVVRIPMAPPDEQRAIADFLDRETARIDALLARKERLIELLQEKRTALITRAVTRGLDPNVPMKDSGVEWLGEVPSHWNVQRTKFVAKLRSGHTPSRKKPGVLGELHHSVVRARRCLANARWAARICTRDNREDQRDRNGQLCRTAPPEGYRDSLPHCIRRILGNPRRRHGDDAGLRQLDLWAIVAARVPSVRLSCHGTGVPASHDGFNASNHLHARCRWLFDTRSPSSGAEADRRLHPGENCDHGHTHGEDPPSHRQPQGVPHRSDLRGGHRHDRRAGRGSAMSCGKGFTLR